jgi:hypothetical protein
LKERGDGSRYGWLWRLLVVVLAASAARNCQIQEQRKQKLVEYKRTHGGMEPWQYLTADSVKAYYRR